MGLSESKKVIRGFMQAHYSDERLAMLLAHAQQGKLVYRSCCCFIGVANAGHALQSRIHDAEHYLVMRDSGPLAVAADLAYCDLAADRDDARSDACRRRILIPMIRAEMKRREKLRALDSVKVSSEHKVLKGVTNG